MLLLALSLLFSHLLLKYLVFIPYQVDLILVNFLLLVLKDVLFTQELVLSLLYQTLKHQVLVFCKLNSKLVLCVKRVMT